MNIATNNFFWIFFFSFSFYFSVESILPEVIATTTLLKYAGITAAVAVGGRYIATTVKEVSQFYQMHFKKIPQSEFYNESFDSGSVAFNSDIQGPILRTELGKSLFTKIKDIVCLKKEQQYQHQSFYADSTSSSSDGKKAYWNQTNIRAQQARGFFPKVNNYHYYSDSGDFWKGATAGSFVTGTTCFYLVVKHKKD